MTKWMILGLLALTGCFEDKHAPEVALQSFIDGRYSKVITRQFILDRTTGNLRAGVERVSEEDFKKFSDFRGVNPNSFRVINKTCENDRCSLVYSLAYKTDADNTVVEKRAQMVKENSKWLISEVSNLSTTIDLEVIKAIE